MQSLSPAIAWDRIPSASAVQCFRANAYEMLPKFAEHATERILESLEKAKSDASLLMVAFQQTLAPEWVNDRVQRETSSREVKLVIRDAIVLGEHLLAELAAHLSAKGFTQVKTMCAFDDTAYASTNTFKLTFSVRFNSSA
jgi:hypothetical protein